MKGLKFRSLPIRIFPWRTWRFYFYGENFVFTSLHWFRSHTSVYSFTVFIRAYSFTFSFILSFQFSKSFFRSIICSFSPFSFIYLFFHSHSSVDLFCFRSLVHSFIHLLVFVLLFLYLIVPLWYTSVAYHWGSFVLAMVLIFARRSRAKISIARPNEPDMIFTVPKFGQVSTIS